MTEQRDIHINIPVLARVEGEGALNLSITNGRIDALNLKIYEPPRLFEKLLEGREYHEVPDMVARICGICPVAYQMSATSALEQIFALQPDPWVQSMRRIFYCGEWIQSHALHIHLLAAPDFLGFSNAADMAKVYPGEVRRGLKLQSLGNDLIRLFGARSVHPVGACVGGFHHAPDRARIAALIADLEQALADAETLITWTASLDFPDDQQDFCSVSLRHDSEYPMMQGRLVSDQGLDIAIEDYEQHFSEYQVPHSTALHSKLDDKPYLVGPLARMNLNSDKLPDATLAILHKAGIRFPCRNMFHSIVARAAEIHLAIVEAIHLLKRYTEPDKACHEVTPRAGSGYGCTEAPRGLLWHKYETDNKGNIVSARIVPPTSQNQARIEQDIATSLQSAGLDQPEEALRLRAEKVIRNYDPCISCATHFLTLKIDRRHKTAPIRVLGMGSAIGADQIGWLAARQLERTGFKARHPGKRVDIALCQSPAHLATEHSPAQALILLDAYCADDPVGRVRRFSPEDLASVRQPASSHGFDLKQALALLASLEEPTPAVSVIGICIGTRVDATDRQAPSGILEKAFPALLDAIDGVIQRI